MKTVNFTPSHLDTYIQRNSHLKQRWKTQCQWSNLQPFCRLRGKLLWSRAMLDLYIKMINILMKSVNYGKKLDDWYLEEGVAHAVCANLTRIWQKYLRYLIFRWLSMQNGRVIWREPILVILRKICSGVPNTTYEYEWGHGFNQLLAGAEYSLTWNTLKMIDFKIIIPLFWSNTLYSFTYYPIFN